MSQQALTDDQVSLLAHPGVGPFERRKEAALIVNVPEAAS